MPPQPAFGLRLHPPEQGGERLGVAGVAGRVVGPTEHAAGAEDVLHAGVGVDGQRQPVRADGEVEVGDRDQEPAVAAVAGGLRELVRPDVPGMHRAVRRTQPGERLRRDGLRDALGDRSRGVGRVGIQPVQPQPSADRDPGDVVHGIEALPVLRRQHAGDRDRCSSPCLYQRSQRRISSIGLRVTGPKLPIG